MKPYYNTPSLRTLEPTPPKPLVGKEALYKLEDDFAEYRHACATGLIKSDPAILAKFEQDIAAAKATQD